MYRGRQVDEMPARALPSATHPYTRTLWTCRPNAHTYGQMLPTLDRTWTLRRQPMAIVNLQDLQVTFGAKTAVSAASFRVDAGETFSLIGASGCGKSTILRVLAGLQREWRGSVDLLGQAITPGFRFQGDLRRNVQMVFQDPYASLHPNHTLWRTGGAAADPRHPRRCPASNHRP